MPMLTISTIPAMRQQVAAWRRAGQTIAFVPTMGALHAGHARLLQEGRRRADRLIASIFVNPTQFGPTEDLAKYPRDLDGDLEQCRSCAVDAVFTPPVEAIYPPGDQTVIEVPGLSAPLCGAFRPGHFRGVATVVYKLFATTLPQVACFGEKDYQQLKVIERMVRDLSLPVEIVPVPTVREPDGLALSSRNQYLSPSERSQATAIWRALQQVRAGAAETRDTAALIAAGRAVLSDARITQIQYFAIVDAETLEPLTTIDRPARCCVAAYVGTTRLIDNVPICAPAKSEEMGSGPI